MSIDKHQVIEEHLTKYKLQIAKDISEGTISWKEMADHLNKKFKVGIKKDQLRGKWKRLNFSSAKRVANNLQNFKEFQILTQKEDKSKGSKEFTFTASKIPSEDEIIKHFKIDTSKFKINQIWHKTSFGGKYSVSVSLLALKGSDTLEINENFLKKVEKVAKAPRTIIPIIKSNNCLVILKQDAHWNAWDMHGKNNIYERFKNFTVNLVRQLKKAETLSGTLSEIFYVVGSDEFNAEWTNLTSKGTPQQNILSFQDSFELVVAYNIEIIKTLKSYSGKVNVVLLNGNHDINVSWHLGVMLKQVFKNDPNISVDTRMDNTKLISFGKSLMLLNHGDEMKPSDLANKFPMIAKDIWSNYSNYTVFTGDRHHEKALDVNGIKTYQVPQLKQARSSWEDKKGYYLSRPELQTFLFDEKELVTIFKNYLD